MDINTLYNIYSRDYEKAEKVQRDLVGIDMYSPIYSKKEFELVLQSFKNENNKLTDEQIIKKMVSNQQSEWTFKQADEFAKYMRSNGKYMTAVDVLRDISSAKEILKTLNMQIKEDGITDGKERQALISSAIFGSP